MLMKAEWIWVGIFRILNVLKIDEFDLEKKLKI